MNAVLEEKRFEGDGPFRAVVADVVVYSDGGEELLRHTGTVRIGEREMQQSHVQSYFDALKRKLVNRAENEERIDLDALS